MVKEMNVDAMTPHGLALLDYFQGNAGAEILVCRDDGLEYALPVKHFFRTPDDFSPIETAALGLCRGRVLDIGAGSGIHSLFLQSEGLDVTAIDISPHAVEIMTRRGVRNAFQADIFNYRDGQSDTLMMLGHGIGIAGDIDGLDKLLRHAHELLKNDGQVLLDSMDVSISLDVKNLAYHNITRRSGRFIGETRIRMEFGGIKGPFFNWLHIDSVTLAHHALAEGFSCEIILEQESGDYLARLVSKK